MAAICATTAGWYRLIGQVTIETRGREVRAVNAPSTDQANGACPWDSSHG